jgi:hypothetical protein
VSIEVELEWLPEPDFGVRVTHWCDGHRRRWGQVSGACDARHIYLFNRSDSFEDTSLNEVRYADIVVE